jgi:hypothetical protein
MISADDAILILRKWEDDATRLFLYFADARLFTLKAHGVVTSLDRRGLVVLEGEDSFRWSVGLRGASFAYADSRAKLPLLKRDMNLKDATCALRISFPSRTIAVLVEP